MKSIRPWMFIAAGVVLLSGANLARMWGQDRSANDVRQDAKMPGLMLAKLASTQRVVTGLITKNFSEIRHGADDMLNICDATQWESHSDPLYGHYRTELRRQAFRLAELADEQNLDGAAFNYMQTMSTCINCHSHCRDVLRIAQAPPAMNRVIPIPINENESAWNNSMPTLRR